MPRAWELRDTVSASGGADSALAEAPDAEPLTLARLETASGPTCRIRIPE